MSKDWLVFKSEWFDGIEKRVCPALTASDIANDILREYIESLPVVYGFGELMKSGSWHGQQHESEFTHRARLICVEPLEQKKCEHRDIFQSKVSPLNGVVLQEFKCANCKAIVKPTGWSEE